MKIFISSIHASNIFDNYTIFVWENMSGEIIFMSVIFLPISLLSPNVRINDRIQQ